METRSKIWLGVGGIALVLLMAIFTLVGRGGGQDIPFTSPTRITDPPAVEVNGEPIGTNLWAEAVRVEQVLSSLEGAPPPSPEQVLEQLVDVQLVLQAGLQETPDDAEVEAHVAALVLGTGEGTQETLDAAGLDQKALEQTVARQLVLEGAREELAAQQIPLEEWLAEQREEAQIVYYQERIEVALAVLAITPTPSPTPEPQYPLAADFSLRKAGGGRFSLYEQLNEGPVVLVFFQKCG